MSEYKDSFVNMISGIGIDIVDVKRFIVYSDKSDIRLSKLFTAKELDYCFRRDPPSNGLAGKFAAKEAVIKMLASCGTNVGNVKEIEILNDRYGKPFVNSSLEGTSKIRISISHDGGFAVAVALMD